MWGRMSSSPTSNAKQSATKRKRKSQHLVIDSDSEPGGNQKSVPRAARSRNAISPSKVGGRAASPMVQGVNDDEFVENEDFLEENATRKPVGSVKKTGPIIRRAKKKASAPQNESSDSQRQNLAVVHSAVTMTGSSITETTVVTSSTTSIDHSSTLNDPWAVDSRTPPSPSSHAMGEGIPKRKEASFGADGETSGLSGLHERPTKRQKLPSMRRNPNSEPITPTKVSSTGKVGGTLGRQIVDAPVTKDIDLRDEEAFSKLFKKSGTGRGETRYDLTTSSERLEQKQIELNKLREEYIAKKESTKVPPFDLGAQNRKLADVEIILSNRNSRVCVNILGSGLATVHPVWRHLAEERRSSAS